MLRHEAARRIPSQRDGVGAIWRECESNDSQSLDRPPNAVGANQPTERTLTRSRHGSFDETGIRAGGKLHWLQTASTENYTHLFIHEKRGQEALNSDASVLKDYKGWAIHDCWAPYFKFESAKHALCGAHLLRELDGLKENGSQWACQMQRLLLELHKTPSAANTQAQVRDQYHRILSQADLEEPKSEPRKRGKAKQSVGRNLYDRFQKYEDEVLAFAFEAGVPFTNNQAERDLRSSKVKQNPAEAFVLSQVPKSMHGCKRPLQLFANRD